MDILEPINSHYKNMLYILHLHQTKLAMGILTPSSPKTNTVIVSLLLELGAYFGASYVPYISDNKDLVFLGGYLILLLGVYIRGL